MTLFVTDQVISVPPEWAPQKTIWTAWPADPDQWNGDLATPRRDVASMVHALKPHNEVRLLVNGAEAEMSARAALGTEADILLAPYGDIWLRDTGPIFARTPEGLIALRFRTNGWGGKFDLPDDALVGDDIARFAGTPTRRLDFVLEGGAIDQDGQGTVLATRETLLNSNRNGWTEAEAEASLSHALGADKIIWLDRGLRNDHTDGHIDNLARFVAPCRIVCQTPSGADDPNAEVLDAVARTLTGATDAKGRKIDIIRIPSPGLVLNEVGEAAPASHMNFVIANAVVIVPVYGTPSEAAALTGLQAIFPDREVIGVLSKGLLAGGGSFHCITAQEPR